MIWDQFFNSPIDLKTHEEALHIILKSGCGENLDQTLLTFHKKKKTKKKHKISPNIFKIKNATINAVSGVLEQILNNQEDTTEKLIQKCFLIQRKLHSLQLLVVLNLSPDQLVFKTITRHGKFSDILGYCFNNIIDILSGRNIPADLLVPIEQTSLFLTGAALYSEKNLLWFFKQYLYESSSGDIKPIFSNIYLEKILVDDGLVREMFSFGNLANTIELLSFLCVTNNGIIQIPLSAEYLISVSKVEYLADVVSQALKFCDLKHACPTCFFMEYFFSISSYITNKNINLFTKKFSDCGKSEKHFSTLDVTSKMFAGVMENLNNEAIDTDGAMSLISVLGIETIKKSIAKTIQNYIGKFNKKNAADDLFLLKDILNMCQLFCKLYNKEGFLKDYDSVIIERFMKSVTIFENDESTTQLVFDDLLAIQLPRNKETIESEDEICTKLLKLEAAKKEYKEKDNRALVQVYPLHKCIINTPVKLQGYNQVSLKLNFFQYKIIDLFNSKDNISLEAILGLVPSTWNKELNSAIKTLVTIKIIKPVLKNNIKQFKLQTQETYFPDLYNKIETSPGELLVDIS